MADEHGDKTELPTDRRRQEVREKGNVAKSVDLNAAALMIAAAMAMAFLGHSLVYTLADFLSASLRGPAWDRLDQGLLMKHLAGNGTLVLKALVPFLLMMAVAAIVANLAQVGFLISTEVLQPKFSRLNPLEGVKRIFSIQGLVKLAISVAKLVLFTSLAAWFIWTSLGQFLSFTGGDLAGSAAATGRALIGLAFLLSLSLLALALLDYGYQRWKFEQDLMMTKQEVREEMRQMEGDPMIRARRREAHRKLALSRQMQQVKEADVVVTNPTHIAVAIKYDAEKMAAPIVVAKGQGYLAERIRTLAAEHGVPIVEKKPLARALYQTVKVGHPVPTDLYEVVAEILAYVYRLKGKAPKNT